MVHNLNCIRLSRTGSPDSSPDHCPSVTRSGLGYARWHKTSRSDCRSGGGTKAETTYICIITNLLFFIHGGSRYYTFGGESPGVDGVDRVTIHDFFAFTAPPFEDEVIVEQSQAVRVRLPAGSASSMWYNMCSIAS